MTRCGHVIYTRLCMYRVISTTRGYFISVRGRIETLREDLHARSLSQGVHVVCMWCEFGAYVMRMWCVFEYLVRIWCVCGAYVVRMCFVCGAYVTPHLIVLSKEVFVVLELFVYKPGYQILLNPLI